MIKSLAIVLFLLALVSCRDEAITVEQCSPYMGDDEQVCFCRMYRFSREYVGPLKGTERDEPLSYCHKVVGFTAKDYHLAATYWEKVRRASNRRSKLNDIPLESRE
jgi:hypothetical protein